MISNWIYWTLSLNACSKVTFIEDFLAIWSSFRWFDGTCKKCEHQMPTTPCQKMFLLNVSFLFTAAFEGTFCNLSLDIYGAFLVICVMEIIWV